MGDGHIGRHAEEYMMKQVYFVTEGVTDQIVIESLLVNWFGDEDFVSNRIQPPSSAYADNLVTALSQGWRGVLSWCRGATQEVESSRNEVLRRADLVIIHIDCDVVRDADFSNPPYVGGVAPVSDACDFAKSELARLLGAVNNNVVFCVPAQDIEAWVLCSLFPEVADANLPIEQRVSPGALLVQRAPYRLVRRKNGALKKDTGRYQMFAEAIVNGWPNCVGGANPRCPEAATFERDIRAAI